MSENGILVDLRTAVETWNIEMVKSSTQAAIDAGIPLNQIVSDGIRAGMESVGRMFEDAEIFLPQVLAASKAVNTALEILEPYMSAKDDEYLGTVVFGTVKGDIHVIGKNACIAMLRGAGYKVVDIGCDVSATEFIKAAKRNRANIIAASALMTTTLEAQREIVRTRNEFKSNAYCIFGGAPCSQEFCDEIRADGYSATANQLVSLVNRMNASEV